MSDRETRGETTRVRGHTLTDTWQKIWEGFHAVAEAAPGEREEMLDRVCGGHAAMRVEIESLLAAAAQSGDFLDRPAAVDMSVADGTDEGDALEAGKDIGPYHLIEELGEGGMGGVFRAAQESPIRREVALKLIRAGLKLAALIPKSAQTQVNDALHEKGIEMDFSQIKPEDLENIITQLDDLTVDVEGKESVRIFCE